MRPSCRLCGWLADHLAGRAGRWFAGGGRPAAQPVRTAPSVSRAMTVARGARRPRLRYRWRRWRWWSRRRRRLVLEAGRREPGAACVLLAELGQQDAAVGGAGGHLPVGGEYGDRDR